MLVIVVLAVIAFLAISSIGSALVYYLTPSELLARGDGAVGETIRLGGQVKPGSVGGDPTDLTFVLTDGSAEITVPRPRRRRGRSRRDGVRSSKAASARMGRSRPTR